MATMIKETTERPCCLPNDLKPYKGDTIKHITRKLKFCVHCGQLWWWVRPPGDIDYGYEKVPLELGASR